MKKLALALLLIPFVTFAQMEINGKYGFGHFVYDPADEDVEMQIANCGEPLIDRNKIVNASIECETYHENIPWRATFPDQNIVNFNSNNAPGILCSAVFTANTLDDSVNVFLRTGTFKARYEAIERPEGGYTIKVKNTCFNLRSPLVTQ